MEHASNRVDADRERRETDTYEPSPRRATSTPGISPCSIRTAFAVVSGGWRRRSLGGLFLGLVLISGVAGVDAQQMVSTQGSYSSDNSRSGGSTLADDSEMAPSDDHRSGTVPDGNNAGTTTTVTVSATVRDVAEAQVQQQEKQRVLGVLPNYYTSYIWAAAPMTPQLKFQLAIRSITDPVTFLAAASLAGAEQMHNTFPGYGRGAEGYAERFGAAYADATIGRMISRAILPSALHQDPRYFYRGSGTVGSRILYALAQSVVCRGDDGRLQPNYSQVAGSFAAAGLSNLYRAPEDRRAALTFRNGLLVLSNGALQNLFREFVSRKLTPHVPAFADGKP